MHKVSRRKLVLLLSALVALALPQASHAQSAAKTFYVSKNATGTVHDGKSWQTAWTDLDTIDWRQLGPDCRVYLDGGSTQMAYNKRMVVGASGAYYHPLYIMTSSEPGHNGLVNINPGRSLTKDPAIDFGDNRYIIFSGDSRNNPGGYSVGHSSKSIYIGGWLGYGIRMGTGSNNIFVQNVEIANCGIGATGSADPYYPRTGGGVSFDGTDHRISRMVVRDNSLNIKGPQQSTVGRLAAFVDNSWIANIEPSSRTYYVDGVESHTQMGFEKCIFGPGLDRAIADTDPSGSRVTVIDSLFINPRRGNIVFGNGAPNLYKCTSFMLPLAFNDSAHNAIQLAQSVGGTRFDSCLFEGGTIVTQSYAPSHPNNLQYKTSGNIAFLGGTSLSSSTFVRPLFSYPNNVSVYTLLTEDYSRNSSNTVGSSLTSISKLIYK